MFAALQQSEAPAGPRAEATRSAIIATAERLFRTLGYRKTAVADIARELGMSPANVYRFFPSKLAINEAICARILVGLSELCWSIARGPGSPPDRLRNLYMTIQRQTMSLLFDDKRMHDMVAVAIEEHWGVIDQHIRDVETAIRHVVMDGQASGDFARLDPEQTAELIHATMASFSHPTVIEQCTGNTFDLEKVAAGMAEFSLRALRP
jgi:AcrR family transcriptional regulator